MNSINIPNSNNEKYIQLTNNIIYQNIHQYYCPSCHSPICSCNNNYFNSKKSEIIYHNFNTENEQQHNSLFLVDPTNLNKKDIKSKSIHIIPINNNTLSSKNLEKKYLEYNFNFYNNKDNQTIYQNMNENNLSQIKNGFYANLNNKNVNNYIRKNGIIYNRRFSPNFNNAKNIDFGSNNNKRIHQDSAININKNILSCRNSKKDILNMNNNPINIDKKIKYRKIFNIKQIKENNKSIGKNSYDSYLNIHQKTSNNINQNSSRGKTNKNKRCITPFINSKYVNKTKKNLLKKSNISIITNNFYSYNQNKNNNNYRNSQSNQINNLNLMEMNQNLSSIEIIKKYQPNICNSSQEKNHIKKIMSLKKNIALDLDTIHSEKAFIHKKPITNRYTNNENNYFKNKFFDNCLSSSKEIINKFYSNDKIDDSNKENISNVNYDSPIINKKMNRKINIEAHGEIKKNYNQKKKLSFFNGRNNDVNYIKNLINNNQIKEVNQNLDIEINDYKQKTEELMTLLQKANNEITQLKKELNGYKKQSRQQMVNLNKNNFYHSNKYISNTNTNTDVKNNFKKNSLKIKIPCGNKNKMNKYNSILSNKKILLKNNQKTFQNHTALSTSNSNISNYNIYRNTYSNIDKITNNSKYIFSIYSSHNKNLKNGILCFDAEMKTFKIKKIIDNISCNFNKHFFESINDNNKTNNSIYLINDNNYYIVTGCNCNKFYEYNFDTNRMRQYSDLNYDHSNGAMISYCNKIICLSGDLTKKVEIYSEEDDTWLELPDMQVERNYFSACIIKNRYLFAFFGYNVPTKTYLNTIEYFDIVNYNINVMNMRITNNINDSVYWKNLEYNYFNCRPSLNNINLVGAISINYKNEKIIFLGGKNGLYDDNEEGYYQLILDDTNMKEEYLNGYIEKIKTKEISNFNNYYYFKFSYKYIEELNQDNILKEPVFVAFDNNYFVHLVKLSTMNHEIYNFNQ